MSELPILVEYGPTLWYAALAAFVVLCCLALAWRRRTRRERLRAVAAAGAIAAALDGAADGVELALEGTLIVGDEPAAPMREDEPASGVSAVELRLPGAAFVCRTLRHAHRAPVLQLRVASDIVVLDGPIELVTGGEERHASKDFADETSPEARAWLPAGLRKAAEACPPIFRLLSDGDRIIAIGALHRGSGDGPGYRDAQTAWSLRPVANDSDAAKPHLRLISTAPLPRTGQPLWRRVARRAMAGALIFIATTWIAGRWLAASETSIARLQLASTIPLTRERALNRLAALWAAQPHADRTSVMGAASLLLQLGRCQGAAELLFDHQQFVLARDLALSCGTPAARSIAARAALADGRYAEASALFDDDGLDVRRYADEALLAHLGAHQWERASRMIEQPEARLHAITRLARPCFVHALAARAGLSPPDEWLHAIPTHGDQEVDPEVISARAQCQILAADKSPDDGAAAAILQEYDDSLRREEERTRLCNMAAGSWCGSRLTAARVGYEEVSLMTLGRRVPVRPELSPVMARHAHALLDWKAGGGFDQTSPALARAASDRLAGKDGWEWYRAEAAVAVAAATELASPEEADAWWRLALANYGGEPKAWKHRSAGRVFLALAIRRGARVVAQRLIADSPDLATHLSPVLKSWLGVSDASGIRRAEISRRWGPDWLVPGIGSAPITDRRWENDRIRQPVIACEALTRAGNQALLAERRGDTSSAADFRARARRHYDVLMDPEIAVLLRLAFTY
jgi:hypothetical protein